MLKPIFKYIPFVGRLPDCSGKDLWEAFLEVGIATAFSTMPIWLMQLIGPMFFRIDIPEKSIQTGELYLFSAALVGPLIYIITKNYGERDEGSRNKFLMYKISFPYGSGFVFYSVAICVLSSIAFTVLRNPVFGEAELSKIINYPGVVYFSWWTFWISIIVFFCATAYKNSIENIGDALRGNERQFANEWNSQK